MTTTCGFLQGTELKGNRNPPPLDFRQAGFLAPEPREMAQAATVEAIFVYNTAMRDQMLPRKPLPHPELEEQREAPLKNVMPGAVAGTEKKKPGM